MHYFGKVTLDIVEVEKGAEQMMTIVLQDLAGLDLPRWPSFYCYYNELNYLGKCGLAEQ